MSDTIVENLIYVVDDNVEFCALMARHLERFGFVPRCFNDRDSYLRAMREKLPTLSLIDLNLQSEGEGYEVIRQVRARHGVEPNLVVISALHDSASIVRALELGAHDYVAKPVDWPLLVAKLSHFNSTEELAWWKGPELELPGDGAPARLRLEAQIDSIDELSVTFYSSHFLPKGSVLHVVHPLFREIFGRDKILVNVLGNWLSFQDNAPYGYNAEFEDSGLDFGALFREWIGSQRRAS